VSTENEGAAVPPAADSDRGVEQAPSVVPPRTPPIRRRAGRERLELPARRGRREASSLRQPSTRRNPARRLRREIPREAARGRPRPSRLLVAAGAVALARPHSVAHRAGG
jgi:hypothetical protein